MSLYRFMVMVELSEDKNSGMVAIAPENGQMSIEHMIVAAEHIMNFVASNSSLPYDAAMALLMEGAKDARDKSIDVNKLQSEVQWS